MHLLHSHRPAALETPPMALPNAREGSPPSLVAVRSVAAMRVSHRRSIGYVARDHQATEVSASSACQPARTAGPDCAAANLPGVTCRGPAEESRA
jgi:hypothetical protein